MTRKRETWKTYGKVTVTRNPRGRFVSWHKVKPRGIAKRRQVWTKTTVSKAPYFFGKRVAVYGTTLNGKGERKRNRIELYGSGRNLYRAIKKFHEGWIPKEPYEVVRAEDIDGHIERGRWEDIEEKS